MKKKRTYNTRLIRKDYSYEVVEIVELFRVHENTVRSWLAEGLIPIDGRRPTMVHGSDLTAFLRKRQTDRKRACQPSEFFCCRCRGVRRPWENLVDIEISDNRKLVLKGVCSHCGGTVNRIGATARLDEYRDLFEVQALTDRRLMV